MVPDPEDYNVWMCNAAEDVRRCPTPVLNNDNDIVYLDKCGFFLC